MSTILTLQNPSVARSYYEAGLWKKDTYYSLLEKHARTQPDAYAIRDSRHRLTYRELLDWTNTLADDLNESGIRQGERVSISLPNCVETVVIFLA